CVRLVVVSATREVTGMFEYW
nr:immunoglobulin heavy chain junction region [Macaca mulatta]MOW76187.1 immunoglobulin heavy chain junction region [Macaca mulatta]MOW77336.1 immunoglobulin heavy chain junction region [Macaca mulatta]MOW78010.1 immunoglobulin heavy chain junction region [Macaca mulatta]MOW81823.1 immunoglobulin heavy chain junction region [Macaca mulatta]